jgi:AP endonuclease-1
MTKLLNTGLQNSIVNAVNIGANSLSLFLKSRTWSAPPLAQITIDAFRDACKQHGFDHRHIIPHGQYIVNLANADALKREKVYEYFVDDLKRCESLGIRLYNIQYV